MNHYRNFEDRLRMAHRKSHISEKEIYDLINQKEKVNWTEINQRWDKEEARILQECESENNRERLNWLSLKIKQPVSNISDEYAVELLEIRLAEDIVTVVSKSYRAGLSVPLKAFLKQHKTNKSLEALFGWTFDQLVRRLESQFNDKMNWNNYGSYWSIDHKKSIWKYRYPEPGTLGFKSCWALANLQPLSKHANSKKGRY